MQTSFTPEQLTNPDIQAAEDILRKCVHCGFCTATCPTYVLLGDELDSPRGRIYLIKDMLEGDKTATPKVAKHLDRCLTCLSCMTTCPASVNYMRLIDIGRARLHETFKRPLPERALRTLLAWLLPKPSLFRISLMGAWLARPFANFLPGRLKGMIAMAPKTVHGPASVDTPQAFPAIGTRTKRVALMNGCAQQVLRPEINEATVRLLTRHECEVVIADGSGCCGALVHHMGREHEAVAAAKANIAAWERVSEQQGGLDAIVINASGCGTTVKDYGFLLRKDPEWAERAARISDITKDITEIMADIPLQKKLQTTELRVTYHSACSMQHGQKITTLPKTLLSDAGFTVQDPSESHICCGSAGTYNLMQPEIASQLQARKVANIKATEPDVIAAGNIGCMEQIANGQDKTNPTPVVHTVELLDWATGGPKPVQM